MGIEDDFYATVKLKSGEEIFAKVAASEEEDRTVLIVNNPIVIQELKGRMGVVGYKFEPWLKTTTEDMFILNLSDVLTMSESSDIEMIMMYQDYVRSSEKNSTSESQSKINRRMGYVANVNEAKELLEKLFNIDFNKSQE
jgi:hypothetical protein|tara:strand:- start:281 stop:700 length:420 start_codon:yes stop_codon:yes gene_type:complete